MTRVGNDPGVIPGHVRPIMTRGAPPTPTPISFDLFVGQSDWFPGSGMPLNPDPGVNGILAELFDGSTWTPITDNCDTTGWTGILGIRLTVTQSDAGSGAHFYGGLDQFWVTAVTNAEPEHNLFNTFRITAASHDGPATFVSGIGSLIAVPSSGNVYSCAGSVPIDSRPGVAKVDPGVVSAPYTYTTIWEAHQTV